MEGEVVCSHLRIKFSSTLEEAETDLGSSLPIISRFRAIERLINTMSDQNSTSMANHLRDLMDALSECTIFAYQRRKQAASMKGFYFFRVVLFQKNMKRRVDEIEKKLKDIVGPQDNINGTAGKLKIQKTYPDGPNPSLVLGFESQVREIEDFLISSAADPAIQEEEAQRFKAVGIVGRCGCGKTALTQKVFASPVIETNFFPMIWVCLSDMLFENERSDLRLTILNHILREIGHDDASDLEYGDHSVVKLLEKLQLGLMGKRYLIVLDDAWRMDEWFADLECRGHPTAESFTHGLPKGSGGAVIVTSRGESVLRRMVGEEYVIRPQLTDDNCWEIFSKAVLQQGKISPDDPIIMEMEACITKNCEGLPLAAKTLANLISNLLAE